MMLEVKKQNFSFEVKDKFELLPENLLFAFGAIIVSDGVGRDEFLKTYKWADGSKNYWFLSRGGEYIVFEGFQFTEPSRSVSKFAKKLSRFLHENDYIVVGEDAAYSWISKEISDFFGIKPLKYEVSLIEPDPNWFMDYVYSNHGELYGDSNSCFTSGKKRSYSLYFTYINDSYFVRIHAYDAYDNLVGGARFLMIKMLDANNEPVYIAINPYSKGIQFSPALWVRILSEIFDIPVSEIGEYLVFPSTANAYEGFALSRLIWVNGIGFEGHALTKRNNLVVVRNNPRSKSPNFLRDLKVRCMGCRSYESIWNLRIYTNGRGNFLHAVKESKLNHLFDIKHYMYNSDVYRAVLCDSCMSKILEKTSVEDDERDD